MKNNTVLRLVAGICVVLVLAVSPLMASCAKPAPAEPIKLGAVLDYTGFLADYGPSFEDGIKLRLDQAGWKVAGRPIELIIEDGGSDVAHSLDKLKKLVERDNVKIIYGPLMSMIGMAVSPYLSEHKITSLCLISHPLEIKEYGNWAVYPGTLYSLGLGLGRYAYEELGYKTVTTVGIDYVAGWQIIAGAVDPFKEAGGTVVQQQWWPVGSVDFGPFLVSLEEADAVMAWAPTSDLMRFVRQYYEFGVKMPLIIPDAAEHPEEWFRDLGDISISLGLVGVTHYTRAIDTPANRAFVAAFEDEYGRKPGLEELDAYVLTDMILAALEATKGDDTFEKLHPVLLGLRLDTAQGPLSFSPSGIAITNRYIVKAARIDGDYVWEVIDTIPNVSDPKD